MQFRRNLLSRLYRNSDPDADAGGGGAADPATSEPPAGTAPADSAPVATGTAPASGGEQPSRAAGMLEAMFGQKPAAKTADAAPTAEEQATAAATGKTVQQLRDERGRFTSGKTEATAAQAANQPPVQPPKPGEKPEHQMPEGLTPKAQERFQTLVNSNKELTTKVAEFEPIVASARQLQQTFHQNGIQRDQFEQAMTVVGMMNRGDLRGALAALDEQRRMIALHLGQPVAGVDMLSDFPDLQQKVANLQMSPADAEEMARARIALNMTRQAGQRQQQERQQQQDQERAQQAQQNAVREGQLAVDKFCKARMADDLDFTRIEPLLIKEIQDGLLQGVPPAQWPRIVEKTYGLIKQTAGQVRATSGATTTVLRPSGGEAPTAKPKNAFEAMWGTQKPAGA